MPSSRLRAQRARLETTGARAAVALLPALAAALLLALAAALLLAGCRGAPPATPAPSGQAEILLLGGVIMTMDPALPRATAVAVRQGQIAYVGDDAGARAWIGPDTRVLDLAGRSVTPGLVDGHAHLYGLGTAMEGVFLGTAASEQAAAALAGQASAALPPGGWLDGRDWDQNRWQPAVFPTRASLDAAVPERPVALRRVDGHALWVNGKALALAGITADTPDPPGGRIVRDRAGAPTGVLVDTAMDLVDRVMPVIDDEVRARRIRKAAAVAVAAGLTGVHEMGIDAATVAVYRRLAGAGELPLRVYAYLSYEPSLLDNLSERQRILEQPGSHFTLRGIKMYADGALGSRGAALLAPYDDEPGNLGLVITDAAELERATERAAAAGWQLGVHAIGDRANRMVLDAFERVLQARPGKDLRFRVEHAQVVALADIPRFGALGVLASMQPTHATSDMPWAEKRVGAERIRGAYAWRKILDAGGRIVGGSDFPVEAVPPRLGLYAAVTRQDAQGQPAGGWYPAERLTLEEAVRIFTVEPAYAAFAEHRRGRLAVGQDADLTVFDRALAADASLLATEVEMTIVGGRVVHASDWAQARAQRSTNE
ncbi:MAG TPA: amidohydrolase [Haliangium sp.]|nr:amidohydrolase [Haliangium sp.]